jgi:Mor family transcriptional regulator
LKYKNATQILPKELMDEVQNYIQGEYLYIPKAEGTKKKWGDNSGYRRNLSIRNDSIRKEHKDGSTISELAEKYYLSENTIKKIVYVKVDPVTEERE